MGASNNVLRKFMITAASGGVGYLITTLAKQPLIWSLTMSIFIGGLSLVVQFLVEVEGRLASLETRQESRLSLLDARQDRQFAAISQATALFGRLDASELRTDTVIQLVETSSGIPALNRPLLTRFVDGELRRLAETLRQILHQQSAQHPDNDEDWMLALTSFTTKSIKATTMLGQPDSLDKAFWSSQLADTYLQLQREATQHRGVRVQRLFIVHQDWITDPEISDIIQQNLKALVEVRVLVGSPFRGIVEFIVFDKEICQEFPTRRTMSGEAKFATTTQLTLREGEVRRRVEQFDTWWDSEGAKEGLLAIDSLKQAKLPQDDHGLQAHDPKG